MIDSICIIGHNSPLGGADTELDHQIDVWQSLGVVVHCMPTSPVTKEQASLNNIERGVVYHEWGNFSEIEGMPVISYCNGDFLENLEDIRKHASYVIWVNCMCWAFTKEVEAVKNGLIDFHAFQTDHQMESVTRSIFNQTGIMIPEEKRGVIRPFFRSNDFPFSISRPKDTFTFCRIQRPDRDKFLPETIHIYQAFPSNRPKEAHIMAWDSKIAEVCQAYGGGGLPDWIKTYKAGQVPVQELYKKSHAFVAPSRLMENLPRVGMEAMASGTVLVVENKGGWKELVDHGETGFLCDTPQDYVYYTSILAYEEDRRRSMARQANKKLEAMFGLQSTQNGWKSFFEKIPNSP